MPQLEIDDDGLKKLCDKGKFGSISSIVWDFYQALQREFDKSKANSDRLTYGFHNPSKGEVRIQAAGITRDVENMVQDLVHKESRVGLEATRWRKDNGEQIFTFTITEKVKRDASPVRKFNKYKEHKPTHPVPPVREPINDADSHSEGSDRSESPRIRRSKTPARPVREERRGRSVSKRKIVKLDADEAKKLRGTLSETGTLLREVRPKSSGFFGLWDGK